MPLGTVVDSITLVNVYFPTKDKVEEQKSLLTKIIENVNLDENPVVIGGDFNTYLNINLDKEGGRPEEQSAFSKRLVQMCNDKNLIDIWRIVNPDSRRFTWRQCYP